MWLPCYRVGLRIQSMSRRRSAGAFFESRSNVSHFSLSAALGARTCQALQYRKHGEPPEVVK